MFKAQTLSGKATYILRGAQTPRGKKPIAKVSVLDVGDVDRTIWDLSASDGSYSATAFPSSVSGAAANVGPASVTTTQSTVSAEGAVGAATYAWTETTADGVWTIENPSSPSTRFTATSVPPDTEVLAEFICTVTDSAGRTTSASVDASARNYGGLGGGTSA